MEPCRLELDWALWVGEGIGWAGNFLNLGAFVEISSLKSSFLFEKKILEEDWQSLVHEPGMVSIPTILMVLE